MVLGVLVGPIADYSLRRAILTYQDDIPAMLTRPVGLILVAFLLVMLYSQFIGRGKKLFQAPDQRNVAGRP
jgi:putative tricarboxylic transport membrane protein